MPFDKPRLFSPAGPLRDNPDREDQDCGNQPLDVALPSRSDRSSATDPSCDVRFADIGLNVADDLAPRDLTPRDSAEHGSSGDEELGLSAELHLLAAHLRGEADTLAERYAPSSGALDPTQASDRGLARRWIWQSIAVGVAGMALLAWQLAPSHPQQPPAAGAAISQTIASARTGMPGSVVVSQDSRRPLFPASVSAPDSPTVVVVPDPAAIRRTQGVAEVGIAAPAAERHPPTDQVEMLRIQVGGFEKVIQKLQAELIARNAAQIESQRQIESLQTEVASLHKQIDDQRHGDVRR